MDEKNSWSNPTTIMLVELEMSTLALSTLSYNLACHLLEPLKSRMQTRFAIFIPKVEVTCKILQRGTKHGVQWLFGRSVSKHMLSRSSFERRPKLPWRACFSEGSQFGIMLREIKKNWPIGGASKRRAKLCIDLSIAGCPIFN